MFQIHTIFYSAHGITTHLPCNHINAQVPLCLGRVLGTRLIIVNLNKEARYSTNMHKARGLDQSSVSKQGKVYVNFVSFL